MSRRTIRRSLTTLAAAAVIAGAFAAPAAADPEIPETAEQSKRLGDGSNRADLEADPQDPGTTAPGGTPFVPMDPSYQRLQVGEEQATANIERVASVPIQPGQATLSNLAFKGDYVFQGSYNGLVAYDVSDPENPQVVSNTICPGFQGDLSIAGNLLFFSVDQPRNGSACGAATVAASSQQAWEGIRIFDISNPAAPAYVSNVKTRCGSHTHTLVPNEDDPNHVYLYNGSYDTSSNAAFCQNPHEQVEIIDVDLQNPASAAVVKVFKPWDAENLPFKTTDRVDGGASTTATTGCHDLTAYPAKGLMAAACEGDGLLFDISDPLNPSVTERVRDENYAFWHTAQFNDAASKVVFQDELGGGSSAVCTPTTQQYRGADAIYSLDEGELDLKGYFKIPRRQSQNENCVGHEGNIVQVPGKDVLVQAWYQGGASLIDFTDATKPKEIGYFDRGPISGTSLVTGGYWATYIHNGYVYGSEIARGFDVLKLKGSMFDDANRHRQEVRNPATQEPITYPWKTAPEVDEDDVLEATATPASAVAGTPTDVTVTVPAGSFEPEEYVDVWSTGADAAVLDTIQAPADGSATLQLTIPASQGAGELQFVVRGDRLLDGLLFRATVTLSEAPAVSTTTDLTVDKTTQSFGSSPATLTATVTRASGSPDGTVTFKDGETVLEDEVAVDASVAELTLPADLSVGAHSFTATFVPSSSATSGSSSSAVAFTVAKATSRISTSFTSRIKTTTSPRIGISVAAPGVTPVTGSVNITVGTSRYTRVLADGKFVLVLPPRKAGTYAVQVTYNGSSTVLPVTSTRKTLTVVK